MADSRPLDDKPAHKAGLQEVLAKLQRGYQLLNALEKPTPEEDVARVQIKEGLRRLEAVSLPEGPREGNAVLKLPGTGDGTASGSAPSRPQSGSPTLGSPGRLQAWTNAVSAAMVQQAMSMHDGAEAPAINKLVACLWPRIEEFLVTMIHGEVEPMIDASLPSQLQGRVKFTKVSLGRNTPKFGPLYVQERANKDIEVHIGITFESDLDVQLTALGIQVGITSIKFQGDLVCLLAPPLTKPPFFGGVEIFFPNPPELDLAFAGAAKVVDLPGLRGAVRGAIAGAIADALVLPRRIALDLDPDDRVDLVDLMYPEPIRVLRFTLISGASLVAADRSLFGQATSDPYVVATLGRKTWTSPIVKKTLDPVWEAAVVDFPVHDSEQALGLKVFDYDFGTRDDLIGVAQPISVAKLLSFSERAEPQKVQLSSRQGENGAGTLCIKCEVLQLTAEGVKPRTEGPSAMHLCLKVVSASGVQAYRADPPFKVRIRVRAGTKPDGGPLPEMDSPVSRRTATGCLRCQAGFAPAPCPPEQHSQGVVRVSPWLGHALEPDLLADESTAASTEVPGKDMAEAMHSVCLNLAKRGEAVSEIAAILQVNTEDVNAFLESQNNAKFREACKVASAKHLANRPYFGEVLQLLLPAVEADGVLELALLDGRQHTVGSVAVPMQRLLAAEGLRLPGPFELEPTSAAISAGRLTLNGSLWLKWLA